MKFRDTRHLCGGHSFRSNFRSNNKLWAMAQRNKSDLVSSVTEWILTILIKYYKLTKINNCEAIAFLRYNSNHLKFKNINNWYHFILLTKSLIYVFLWLNILRPYQGLLKIQLLTILQIYIMYMYLK